MRLKSPTRGLQVIVYEESELLDEDLEPVVRKAFETGVLMDGQVSENIRRVLERLGIPMPKQPDEVTWSSLKYSPVDSGNNRLI